ncbi:hypothetical protein [Microscilla marina]|uniref:Uncharacterized protein n=1 Tax=Microscilla marina ATCC 23134 TaxID=313606 RepID=A1ZYQ6_MICM2|nr:hypothetical protein [Microscilla marina]EAY24480.1 hypothetical protein M23134_06467 [Microscilla marina ATCC 23134]
MELIAKYGVSVIISTFVAGDFFRKKFIQWRDKRKVKQINLTEHPVIQLLFDIDMYVQQRKAANEFYKQVIKVYTECLFSALTETIINNVIPFGEELEDKSNAEFLKFYNHLRRLFFERYHYKVKHSGIDLRLVAYYDLIVSGTALMAVKTISNELSSATKKHKKLRAYNALSIVADFIEIYKNNAIPLFNAANGKFKGLKYKSYTND